MPRFQPNPTSVDAGFPVYPAADYEIILGDPKSFYRPGKNGKADNYGVTFRSTIAEGDKQGKPIMINCYMHTPESEGFSKQIQMAALGYPKDAEDKFNAEVGAGDWSFNTDDNSVGEEWTKMKGTRLIVTLTVKMGEGGVQQQGTAGFRPIG